MNLAKRVLFGLVSTLVLVLGAAHLRHQVQVVRTAARTTGIVLDPGPGGRHASILFHLPDGTPVQMQSEGLFGAVRHGQTVPVLFSPDDPAGTAQVGWFGPLFGMDLMLAAMGLAFLLVALFVRD